MTIQDYLKEDGSGPSAGLLVPDLTGAHGTPVQLLLVLESPHVDELAAGHPLAGRAGRDAYAFLTKTSGAGRSLGEEAANRHKKSDFRVGILNVSRVPLQRQASLASSLTEDDWGQIEALRGSQARAVHRVRAPLTPYAVLVLAELERRVALVNITKSSTVAVAGRFAQLFWHSLSSPPVCQRVLDVPHPARGQWKRSRGEAAHALEVLRNCYRAATKH